MKKIYVIRGAFLNPFELQNYSPLKDRFDIQAISSKFPISDKIDMPLIRLWSPTDLPDFPYKFPILNRLYTDAHQLFGLEKVIRGSDIVHVAETYYGYTHQAIMAKRRGLVKKIVSTVWETIPFNNEGIPGRKQYKQLARENIDHFIAVTERARHALIKEGVRSEKISVVPVGIDTGKFSPRKEIRNKRDLNILCVARLVSEKGIQDLVEAFLKISEKNKNIQLTIVGSGPLKSDYSGFRRIFIKTLPYSKMPNEYRHADIFCLPSRPTKTWEEQYGMSLLEAMSSGLPVITTDTGAISEVCGNSAIYAKHSDPVSLRHALEKLIYNKDIRLAMGKGARIRAVQKYNRLEIARQIEKIYNNLIK